MLRSKSNAGNMSVRDAGRKGGESTARTYGPSFYSRIGSKGGRNSHKKNDQHQ